jgi:polyhydroxyalkanoate synthase
MTGKPEGRPVPANVSPAEALARFRREIDRTAVRARNGVKHLSGFSAAAVGETPRDLVWTRDKVALFRYRPLAAGPPRRPPVLLVMSLVTRPYVFDLRPGNSLVARLLEDRHDVYLLDWGVPDAVEAENTLETYCDEYLPHAARATLDTSGATGLTLFGYCLGGVLGLLTAAGHPDLPVHNIALLATPIDFAELGPMANLLKTGRLEPDEVLDETGNVPASTLLEGFRMMAPTGDVLTLVNLWNSFTDEAALAAHQALVRWSGDHIPFPGAAFRQIVDLFVRRQCLVDGKVPLGGRVVDLGSLRVPVLDIIGTKDHLVPRPASEPLASVLSGADLQPLHLPAGHAGLILGRKAQREFIPAVLQWLDRHSALISH